jgi:hypothetical protein
MSLFSLSIFILPKPPKAGAELCEEIGFPFLGETSNILVFPFGIEIHPKAFSSAMLTQQQKYGDRNRCFYADFIDFMTYYFHVATSRASVV